MAEAELNLWNRYKATGSQRDRNLLVEDYLPLADQTAEWMVTSLPPQVDVDDIKSAAYMGLVTAVERFDPDKGYQFKTFANHRIRGAVLDYLRSLDWAPRSLRLKIRLVRSRSEQLMAELGREPTLTELAEALEWTEDEILSTLSSEENVKATSLYSRTEATPTWDEAYVESALYARSTEVTLDDEFDYTALLRQLTQAIENLDPRERIVLTLFYYEQLSLAKIGRLLNVTESWVCQLLMQACVKCRDELDLDHLR